MSISHRIRRPPQAVTLANVDEHQHSDRQTLRRRQRLLRELSAQGEDAIAAIGPRLLPWTSDDKNLNAAWQHLEREGGQAAGPDGLTYDCISNEERWAIIRGLSRKIADQTYGPGEDRRVRIPKSNGRHRTLSLQNIPDRVVARATQQILQPLIQPRLLSSRCGYRATGDRCELLAAVEHFACDRGLFFTVKNDIADAFDNVPHERLLQLLPRLIPSAAVVDLVGRVSRTDGSKGIRQGSPLSPLLLDVYLDHSLFRRWSLQHPDVPLLRYADDVLALCPTAEQALDASHALAGMIREAGFRTKYDAEVAVGRLAAPASIEWLGMELSTRDGQLTIVPDEDAWQQLGDRLTECHQVAGPALAAREVLFGWFGQLGPCYEHQDHHAAYCRAVQSCRTAGLDEAIYYEHVQAAWQTAHKRWLTRRSS